MKSFNTTPVKAQPVRSFGAGGQAYIANIFSGFKVTAERINPLFSIAENSGGDSSFLTNLQEANRLGSTENFAALQLGIRAVKYGDTAPTIQEIHDMKKLIASAKVSITIGSNKTQVGEFSGFHFLNTVEAVSSDNHATAIAVSSCGSVNTNGGWVNLPTPICLEPSVNIGGEVRFARNVPASLIVASEEWAFVVILAGKRQTK